MRRAQGSFEYIIILAVVVLIALVIISALSAFGIIDLRNKAEVNVNEINNLIQDVAVSYAINWNGYVQASFRSVVNARVVIYNFTISNCLFELNATELTSSWQAFGHKCNSIRGVPGDRYYYDCSITYLDSVDILHSNTGVCYGFFEE